MNYLIKKWRELPQSVKASMAFIFSTFLLKGLSFITTPIFTRIMDSSQFGIVSTYSSWISILEIFALLGLTSAGVFNIGLKDNKDNRYKYISNCLGLCNLATIIFAMIIIVLKCIFGADFLFSNKLFMIMIVHFLFSPALLFWITKQKYEYKYKAGVAVNIVSALISIAVSIIMVLSVSEEKGFARILSNEIVSLLFCVPIYFYILTKGKSYVDFKVWKTILIYAIPLIPHYLAQHVMTSSDKIMLSSMSSDSDAGIYSVVANISMIGSLFWNSINASLVPYTFEKIEEKNYEKISSVSNKLILLYAVICIGIILIAPEVLKILAPEEYYKGIYIVPPIALVAFMQALYNLFGNVEFYHKATKKISVATIIATIVNLILNYIFIPHFGFIAAAYATLVSYVVLVLVHYTNYKACQKEKIYDAKFLFTTTLFLLIFSVLCNVLYMCNIIRYVFIVLLFFFAIKERKRIVEIVKLKK